MSENGFEQMNLVEIARKLAEFGQGEKAIAAYTAALNQDGLSAEERFEAACAVFQYSEDYKIAYDAFLSLYREGQLREETLSILTEAFYLPNVKTQEKQYRKNCKLLKNYPYLFKKDFLPFEELPVAFYPYDDNGVLPFYQDEERFDEYIDFNESVVRHYFFRDLSKPVLAKDVFSQYELEYLKDSVRRSDWVGYENHIYLHYSDWGEFCSYLQCIDLKPILEDEKIVFLIGEEIGQYPIDFKERFGIDYSQYRVKPIGIREVNKIVWHTQFHAHCGGDFFNEILHEHPNLFAGDTIMFENIFDVICRLQYTAQEIIDSKGALLWGERSIRQYGAELLNELCSLKKVTLKDALVAVHLGDEMFMKHLDPSERIVPAIMFQPHFHDMHFRWQPHPSGAITVTCDGVEELKETGLLQQFKYIKTFSPLRRLTTSHGGTLRFMMLQVKGLIPTAAAGLKIIPDTFQDRLQNRAFMVAKSDRLFADSRIVRFEDGKLNPKATFTALAEFLDIPYTESMTYCSGAEGRNPLGIGFKSDAVYRTYDEFVDNNERKLLEYVMRDVYEYYGYGYEQYDGLPMTKEELELLLDNCRRNLELTEESWRCERENIGKENRVEGDVLDALVEKMIADDLARCRERRLLTVQVMQHGLSFCNEKGEKLELMRLLEPDPALLEQPLYH